MKSSSLRIIAVLLAIGAIFIAYMGFQSSQTPERPADVKTAPEVVKAATFPVIVAAHALPAGTFLSEKDISIVMSENKYPEAYINKDNLLGQQTRLGMIEGEIILNQHLRQHGPLVQNIRPDERAIAIKVDEVTGVGGFIKPGNQVDVIFYLPAGKESGPNSTARVILSNVRILAYGNDLELIDKEKIHQQSYAELSSDKTSNKKQDANQDDIDSDDKPQGKKSKTAVLAVMPNDLPALLLAESTGRIRLAVHGVTDNKTTDVSNVVSIKSFTSGTNSGAAKPSKQRVLTSKVYVHKGNHTEAVSVKRGNY